MILVLNSALLPYASRRKKEILQTSVTTHQGGQPPFTPRQCYPAPTRTDRQGTVKKIIMSVIKRDSQKGIWWYSSYLTDILVADTADLLDVGSTLGDTLQGVTGDLELILNVGGGDDLNARLGGHTADVLLTQEVSVKRKYPSAKCSFLQKHDN